MTETQKNKIVVALQYMIPILNKHNFKWDISEGLARYIYGIEDNVKEIAIDVDVDKDDEKFKSFMLDVNDHTTLPLKHWVDKVFNHYVMEVTVEDIILSICPTKNMNIINKNSGKYELFYKDGIPTPNMVSFEGLEIPVLPRDRFTQMEESFKDN